MTYTITNTTEREDGRICYEYIIYDGSKIYRKSTWLGEEDQSEDIEYTMQTLTKYAEIDKVREAQPK